MQHLCSVTVDEGDADCVDECINASVRVVVRHFSRIHSNVIRTVQQSATHQSRPTWRCLVSRDSNWRQLLVLPPASPHLLMKLPRHRSHQCSRAQPL